MILLREEDVIEGDVSNQASVHNNKLSYGTDSARSCMRCLLDYSATRATGKLKSRGGVEVRSGAILAAHCAAPSVWRTA